MPDRKHSVSQPEAPLSFVALVSASDQTFCSKSGSAPSLIRHALRRTRDAENGTHCAGMHTDATH